MEHFKEALLIMDVQPGIVDRLNYKDEYLDKTRQTIDHAHANSIPVIFVVVGFRKGLPEISGRNRSFSSIKSSDSAGRMVDPVPVIELSEKDVLVVKKRVSAFTGSDLEVLLRAKNINRLVLCGIATSGVVLSTLREAADKDYSLAVLSDLSADFDQEVHKVLIEKVFPRQAEVLTSNEWMDRTNENKRKV